MAVCSSARNIILASTALAALTLTACASQPGNSRYGGGQAVSCPEPCLPVYQQPAYVESYYQVPVEPQAPMPAPLPAPTPPVSITPPPSIACPSGTELQDNGTCLQLDQPVYIPPVIGYTPDPVSPPKIYKPIRK